ncbi:GumC family protein [Pseudomonas protegens]|uniref:GumC family protein n=1 Tax=Pseudomonas protegens TaxID=380021 RepID=UPI00383B777A
MTKSKNYLQELLQVLFVKQQTIKLIFISFTLFTLLLPLLLTQKFEVSAEVIVQSKKLSQTDITTLLSPETNKFIPLSLADMETEVKILQSPSLTYKTVEQLYQQQRLSADPETGIRLFISSIKSGVKHIFPAAINNLLFNVKTAPEHNTALLALSAKANQNLKVATLPGSNVISLVYTTNNPSQGTDFVEQLLNNYLEKRQELQSNELPRTFFEQKKVQYQRRLDTLEDKRQALLESVNTSAPDEEITFRLNAISIEEVSLNSHHDQALENQRRLDYLQKNLTAARRAGLTDYTFPSAFANSVDGVVYEDREIKKLGEQLADLVSQYGTTSDIYQNKSVPMQRLREQIIRTRGQFLQVVENRIRERSSDLQITHSVIAQKNARINDYKVRIRNLQEVRSKLRQLDTEIDALHKAFFTYTQRYEESRSEYLMSGDLSNARILSYPFKPSTSVFPKPMLIIPLGVVTGLLLAIALGYIHEFFDHRFKHPSQISEHMTLPLLMVIDDASPTRLNPHPRGSWQWVKYWFKR